MSDKTVLGFDGREYPVTVFNKRECYKSGDLYFDAGNHLVAGTSANLFPCLTIAKSMADRAYYGRYRKTTGLPYIDHPIEVYRSCMRYPFSHGQDTMYAAAVLHDYLEDAVKPDEREATVAWMKETLGATVTHLVAGLTNAPKGGDGLYPLGENRVDKTTYLNGKLLTMSSKELFIKLLDMASNLGDAETIPHFVTRIAGHIQHIRENEKILRTKLSDDHYRVMSDIECMIKYIY